MARFSRLSDWLRWQETAHWPRVDPSLIRASAVLQRMVLSTPPFPIVTIAGTNGKGSTVALLEAILLAAGYRVGSYTSPHLLRYNERIKIQGEAVSDDIICQSFARIDAARHEISLTYFEFGTLAAIDIFHQAGLDIALLEVGLGGRLDAVNALDADVAVITTVDIDHINFLGPDRESIGFEKAGIFRSHRPAICGDPEPPESVLAHAKESSVPLYRIGRDFHYQMAGEGWSWWSNGSHYADLPHPALQGACQYQNGAAALMALKLMAARLPVSETAIRDGLSAVRLPGRFQCLPGEMERIFDVAHNLQGARWLARSLTDRPCGGRTYAVLGMLADKDVAGVVSVLENAIHGWFVGGLAVDRGLSGQALAERMGHLTPAIYQSVAEAYRAALEAAQPGDRVLAFGSFHTVEAVMRLEGLTCSSGAERCSLASV
ncbi:Folylpolyglutamate synthetase [Nitrosococcus oceani ATCC 19707]|uniref:Dihydrofolate synthase/folylpolyglutamate synthase n=2 Tax=Nitrosococcus oceani TaxID=1229 RepID=Q3JCB5_NITOC|nr:bifunctional tetrahydrofolate synthase/dihydrofolate synthase [Nitrosococcus oceani]ABA57531.1 Folylpolyglutamate synthetase [Nitrosococcus oceani ATCC 19707]EDZ66908.1 FolC bifunctional protein [Nitrosococcus oceani AFC27]KFI20031.1 folylpolyglutamate synthase [Nitrosococcus oceani C-27]GEM20679.1 bifunctional tetrahydrofolate synthase/dihydrofolate synthase [Nitrosococcus oceani]